MLGGVELKEGEGIEVDFADLELSEVDFKAVLPKPPGRRRIKRV